MSNSLGVTFFIITCILVLVLVFLITTIIVKQYQINTCERWPASWCYTDWLCLDPKNENNAINMSYLTLFGPSGTNVRCANLTKDTVKEFKYSDGEKIFVKYPEYEVNIWSLGCDVKKNNCPFYIEGDVYWPACSGNPDSKFYTDPKKYEQLAADALLRKKSAENVK